MRPMFEFYNHDSHVGLEEELELRDREDSFMIEANDMCWIEEYDHEEGFSYPLPCNPLFEFRVYQYSELNQSYEIDITNSMTAHENFFIQNRLYEIYCDRNGGDV